MNDILASTTIFGVAITILSYRIGELLQKKFKLAIFNPLLVSIVLIIVFLLFFNIDYEVYYEGAKYISFLLTPTTVCLAIPLYQKIYLLKNDFKAIIIGVFAGVISSLGSIFLLALLFGLNHQQYVTLLPKSITTAIGIAVSGELGGSPTITVMAILITGMLGNISAEFICKISGIRHPIAKGIAIGSASHAMGTAKAMEIGDTEGAMSSLAIVISGLLTVIGASVFAQLI